MGIFCFCNFNRFVFINFELLPNGLIVRANCNQRILVLGIKISDIKSIELVGHKINNNPVEHSNGKFDIEFEGEITIVKLFSDQKARFKVLGNGFKELASFFQAKQLGGRLKYSIAIKKL